MRGSNKGAIVAIASVITAFGLSSCGIAVNASPTALPLSRTAALSAISPPPAFRSTSTNGAPFPIYLLSGGRLTVRTRYYTPPSARIALLALDFGPFANEIKQGISTEIAYTSSPVTLVSFASKTGVATVELGNQFEPPNLFGTRLAEAFAEIVYTLTAPDAAYTAVRGVKFELGRDSWPAYLPNGSVTFSPVTYKDYQSLAPPSS